MFDVYIRSLSKEKKEQFLQETGITKEVLRNCYLRPDPLKRNVPRPETLYRMVKASGFKLKPIALLEYFVFDVFDELAKLDPDYVRFKQWESDRTEEEKQAA